MLSLAPALPQGTGKIWALLGSGAAATPAVEAPGDALGDSTGSAAPFAGAQAATDGPEGIFSSQQHPVKVEREHALEISGQTFRRRPAAPDQDCLDGRRRRGPARAAPDRLQGAVGSG